MAEITAEVKKPVGTEAENDVFRNEMSTDTSKTGGLYTEKIKAKEVSTKEVNTKEENTKEAEARKVTAEVPEDAESGMETFPEGSEGTCPHCSGRHKKRTKEEQKKLLTRLRRVEGQIRGIEKMVENDGYCPDILIQVSAATSALNSFNKELLACHIRSCVVNDIREGKDETIDELCKVMQRLMK